MPTRRAHAPIHALSTRFRRRRRLGIALAAVVATISATAVMAVPALAETGLSLTVVGGDRQISAAWPSVSGADGYVVHWGAGSRTNHTIEVRGTSLRISGVTNQRVYSVRVTVRGVAASSTRRTARPVPSVPTPITRVTAKPDGTNRILVAWSGGGRARSVAVLAGADSMMRASRFSTSWMPAAVRSTVITVPPRLRDTIGAGSGNVVFVKVVQSNSTASNPRQSLTFSLRDKYRLTPSGTWSIAGARIANDSVSRLTVATWNVQSVTASAASRQHTWAVREPRVAANIENVRPDLIGLQELTTARIDPGCLNHHGQYTCTEQYQTLQSSLSRASIPYLYARTDADAWVYTQSNTYVDSALFYNPAKLHVVTSGFLSPRALLGKRWPSTLGNEAGMWAEFTTVPTGNEATRTFVAASIHLPAGDHAALRAEEAEAVNTYLDARSIRSDGSHVPIVLTGDFNDNGALTPGAPSLKLLATGWFDAAATVNRTGIRYSTSNGTNGSDGVDPGYPVHAVIHPSATGRIDYIMLKYSPHSYRYQNLVRLLSGDRFDPEYQGSDHDMQVAAVGISGPTSGR